MPPRPALTIGTFDGVHRGHAALIARAREAARPTAGKVIALVFEPHPLSKLRPESVPARLTTFERRAELLREAGADEVIRLEPTAALLGLSAEAFIERLVREHTPTAIVEGADFRFGQGRRGDVGMLKTLGERHGFAAYVVEPVEVDLSDQHIVRASSTLIRWLLEQGRVQDAARVLGREHEVEGVVRQGDRRGRELGFPTANIEPSCLAPQEGVYAAVAVLPDASEVPAAVSVGSRPMFDAPEHRVEAHLLLEQQPDKGLPLPGLPEYGWPLRLRLIAYLREQMKFDSLETFIAQMHRDCTRAREFVANRGSQSSQTPALAGRESGVLA